MLPKCITSILNNEIRILFVSSFYAKERRLKYLCDILHSDMEARYKGLWKSIGRKDIAKPTSNEFEFTVIFSSGFATPSLCYKIESVSSERASICASLESKIPGTFVLILKAFRYMLFRMQKIDQSKY